MLSNNTPRTNYVEFPIDFNADFSFFGLISNFFAKSVLNDHLLTNTDSMAPSLIIDNISNDVEIVEESDQLIVDNI